MSSHLSATRSDEPHPEDSDYAAAPARPFTLRDQVRWTLLGLAVLVVFIALLIQDQSV